MPTRKPRLTITLDPRLHETISRMSKVSGDSMSEIINSMLMAIHEPLMRTVALIEAAQDAPESVRQGLRATAEQMEWDLGVAAQHSLVQLDLLFPAHEKAPIHEKTEEVFGSLHALIECAKDATEGGEKGADQGALDPHVVTRGSGLAGSKKIKGLARTRSERGRGPK